jgi:PAS domain-containing protein
MPILEDPTERATHGATDQWFQWIDRFIPGDDDEILSIGRDVTDRHHAETALAASEARYRDLAEKSADVVWHFSLEPTPHFDYMSPSVERILGYSPSYFLDDFDRMLEILDEASTTAILRAITENECSITSTSGSDTPTARSSSARLAPRSCVVGCKA